MVHRMVNIEVTGTERMHTLSYAVVAQGEIILSSTLIVPRVKKFSFKFVPSFEVIPQATVIVFYITPGGEIISDSSLLEFGSDLRNFVSL